jgi:hypothetical protein
MLWIQILLFFATIVHTICFGIELQRSRAVNAFACFCMAAWAGFCLYKSFVI